MSFCKRMRFGSAFKTTDNIQRIRFCGDRRESASIGVRLSSGRWLASERASQRSNPRFKEASYRVGVTTGYWIRRWDGLDVLLGAGRTLMLDRLISHGGVTV